MHSRLASAMTAASWKALRSAVENEDWNFVVSTLLHELHCHSECDLVSILRATIDEAHRRQEHNGRKCGKDKGNVKDVGKGKDKGEGSYTFITHVDSVDRRFGMLAKLVGINGENVHHIQDVTEANVWIKSGSWPAYGYQDHRGFLGLATAGEKVGRRASKRDVRRVR